MQREELSSNWNINISHRKKVIMTRYVRKHTGWRTKCHTIDCARNTFLLLKKHLTSGTELILIGWKIVPNEEHVQCDHCFDSQPLANEPLHSSQLFDTSLQKARGTTSLCGPWAALHFLVSKGELRIYSELDIFLNKHLTKQSGKYMKDCMFQWFKSLMAKINLSYI